MTGRVWTVVDGSNVLHSPSCGYVVDERATPFPRLTDLTRPGARAWFEEGRNRDRRLCLRCRPPDPRLTLVR